MSRLLLYYPLLLYQNTVRLREKARVVISITPYNPQKGSTNIFVAKITPI